MRGRYHFWAQQPTEVLSETADHLEALTAEGKVDDVDGWATAIVAELRDCVALRGVSA